jgi:hypothetical protein
MPDLDGAADPGREVRAAALHQGGEPSSLYLVNSRMETLSTVTPPPTGSLGG